jgi:hypothetical protein
VHGQSALLEKTAPIGDLTLRIASHRYVHYFNYIFIDETNLATCIYSHICIYHYNIRFDF